DRSLRFDSDFVNPVGAMPPWILHLAIQAHGVAFMAPALGKARKDLSADSLFRLLRSRFDSVPDPRERSDQIEIPLGDALMAAFAMVSLKAPSLLAFDHRRRDPHDKFRSLSGIDHIPCDTQMRGILDPLDPAELRPGFSDVFRRLQRGTVL